jgi:hypothetical protein
MTRLCFLAVGVLAVICQDPASADLQRFVSADGRVLDLRGQNLPSEAWRELQQEAFRTVEVALLARSSADDSALLEVARLPLRTVDLFGTATGDRGVEALRGKRLTELDLSGTQITDAGLRSLESMPLRRLVLRDTRVSSKGVEALVDLPIERLDLSFTSIGDDVVGLLVRIRELESLDLSNTRLTDEGLGKFALLPRLRMVNVAETSVSLRAVEELRSLRPEIDVQTTLDSR